MAAEIYYVVLAKTSGRYLTARPHGVDPDRPVADQPAYLLLFRERFEALSYLNAHAPSMADQFVVESQVESQIKGLMQRWNFAGVGIVQDPLVPTVEFLSQR